MTEIHHETVHFSGRVQGVGFRFTTLQVAKEFDVCGHVSNLPDGRVLLEVEGRTSEVDAFIGALQERMHGYIRQTERHADRRGSVYNDFCIR